jgi:hypothetical protein
MPGAVAYPEGVCGVAAGGLATVTGSALDKSGDAVAGCAAPELVPAPWRAGVFDDLLQAIVMAKRKRAIVIINRFTGILLLFG